MIEMRFISRKKILNRLSIFLIQNPSRYEDMALPLKINWQVRCFRLIYNGHHIGILQKLVHARLVLMQYWNSLKLPYNAGSMSRKYDDDYPHQNKVATSLIYEQYWISIDAYIYIKLLEITFKYRTGWFSNFNKTQWKFMKS